MQAGNGVGSAAGVLVRRTGVQVGWQQVRQCMLMVRWMATVVCSAGGKGAVVVCRWSVMAMFLFWKPE